MGAGRWVVIAALVGATAACGKKGPPLAPIVRVPAAPELGAAVRRLGTDLYVTVTAPRANLDATFPADVARIEVYGFTSVTPPPAARFLEGATLVATIPVAPPILEPGMGRGDPPRPPVPVEGAEPEPTILTRDGVPQGGTVVIRDSLDADELRPRDLTTLASRRPPPAPRRGAAIAPAPVVVPVLRRYYMAIAWSGRGVPGARSAIVDVVLGPLPPPPSGVVASYTENGVTLRWEPSGGLLAFLLESPLPLEPPPFDAVGVRPAAAQPGTTPVLIGATRYRVYRYEAPDPLVLPDTAVGVQPWHTPIPPRLNPVPATALVLTDSVAIDERVRCYEVRAVRELAGEAVESLPAPPLCVTPVDVFPPAVPTGLSAIPTEGAINLIWEPNAEVDFGGYVVLRGNAGDATLSPLTATPIADSRFTDSTVKPGVRYRYAVMAVDTRLPLPNRSLPSVAVEETAR